MGENRPLTAVVCDDRPEVRRTATGVLARCGYDVVGEAEDFAGLDRLLREDRPSVVVLSLPVVGISSLAAVTALRSRAPGCEVVLLSSFDQLEVAALEAGATALVSESDPQALQAVLRQIAATGPRLGEPPAPRRAPQPAAPAAGPSGLLSDAGSHSRNPSS
jgi:DNA-binding NarL/FixJ family response regulator